MKPTLVFLLILSTLLLSACNPPPATDLSTPAPATRPPLSEITVRPSPIPQECYFNWASQPLPELSAQVQSAMDKAGLANVTVFAEAYGENCYGEKTNEVIYFATMETDFRLTVAVNSLEDERLLGNLLEEILTVLDDFPAGTTPGPQPGYIGVNFQSGKEELRLWFTVPEGESARRRGLHGAELLEALRKK